MHWTPDKLLTAALCENCQGEPGWAHVRIQQAMLWRRRVTNTKMNSAVHWGHRKDVQRHLAKRVDTGVDVPWIKNTHVPTFCWVHVWKLVSNWTLKGYTKKTRHLTTVPHWSSWLGGFVVNVVPGHLVLPPGSSGHPHSENELLVKCSSQQLQHFSAFRVVRQICDSLNTRVILSRIGMSFLQSRENKR